MGLDEWEEVYMVEYRIAGQQELSAVAELFAAAFQDYPLFQLVVKDNNLEQTFLQNLHAANVAVYSQTQCCLVGIMDGEIVSAALLQCPGNPAAGLWDFAQAGGKILMRNGGMRRTIDYLSVSDEAAQVCGNVPEPAWYLDSLGVSGARQGQRLGSRMLNDGIRPYIAQNGGGTLTLITNTEQNRAFYVQNGLEEFNASTISRNGRRIENWAYRVTIASLY